MPFTLKLGCIDNLQALRKNYKLKTGFELTNTPSRFGRPTLLGGKDIKTRHKQVLFIERLQKGLQIQSAEHIMNKLSAVKLLIFVCLDIQKQIGSTSDLYSLINNALGISADNFLDKEELEDIYSAGFNLISNPEILSEVNKNLTVNERFTPQEWGKLILSLQNTIAENKKLPEVNSFPVTTLIRPFFKRTFQFTGRTVGLALAYELNNSPLTIAPRLSLSAALASALAIGTGRIAPAIAAPIAANLVGTFCALSVINFSEKAFTVIGIGTGTLVALPFDLFYQLCRKAGSLMIHLPDQQTTQVAIEGIVLKTGNFVNKDGEILDIQWFSAEQLKEHKFPCLKAADDGTLELEPGSTEETDLTKNIALAIEAEIPAGLTV